MAKEKWIKADELMQQLEADPEWVAARDARDARRAERTKRIDADEASILSDLAGVGVSVSSVYDFTNKHHAPDIALPVLLQHLEIEHHRTIREGLIRALGIQSARSLAFQPLRTAFMNERDHNMRWVTANALSGMARFEEVVDIPGIEVFADLFPKCRQSTR